MKFENVLIAAILSIGLLASAALASAGTDALPGSMSIDAPAGQLSDPIPALHDRATAFDVFSS